ncbi:autorepressor SdpR family transcription factor [Verrucomicrobium sp. BvORR106]|uniref:autorepressor SdpR family transcription factor n=1 Tax=Verrucomicrobium sp. BvORR106 TaxID=1403819 RepID=UPI000570516F|nr:autorepressor SdpR family transcription factor [Verrucomicrobium sp. BvORR106]
MTTLFQALNDDTRRAILDLLRGGDLSAGAIAEHFKLGRPTVSHHLDLLKRAGLVTSEKQGQFVIYSLATSVVEDAIRWLLSLTAAKPAELPESHEKATDQTLARDRGARRPSGVSRRRLATDP